MDVNCVDDQKSGCCSKCSSTNFYLYASHTLSAWGDRMWQFATGMFLIALQPNSLRLTATYAFSSGGAVLLFGPIVGDWVDKHQRLKVVRAAIVVQNLSVALSALTVCLTLTFQSDIELIWGGWLMSLCQATIIIFGIIGDVSSIGRTIAVERDWIVVICKDKHRLTSMSALLRRIDLTTKLVAPVLTGQIITYGSMFIGSLFISIWNLISMVFEYNLLLRVYRSCPELATKEAKDSRTPISEVEAVEATPLLTTRDKNKEQTGCCSLVFKSFLTVARGWKTYWSQPILMAGLALATTYMTVLGFDNITAAFAKDQGLSESIVGLLQSVGALFGVTGTLLFPYLRRRFGLVRAGLISFFLLLISLVPCVVSIWMPGSPFEPDFFTSNNGKSISTTAFPYNDILEYDYNYGLETGEEITNTTAQPTVGQKSFWSIGFLMGGIVVARTGLWMSDLSVTQLLLETPEDSIRGIVNGVQNSLNQFEDLLKSMLVIILPLPETFGWLILVSFVFISLANIFFIVFSQRSGKSLRL